MQVLPAGRALLQAAASSAAAAASQPQQQVVPIVPQQQVKKQKILVVSSGSLPVGFLPHRLHMRECRLIRLPLLASTHPR